VRIQREEKVQPLQFHQNMIAQGLIARTLVAGEIASDLADTQDDVEVPDDVEHILEELFEALQDKV
jgi:hypothetical protein